jgi:hypothetical protein
MVKRICVDVPAPTAIRARRHSLGSVIGQLDSVSVHRGKRAGLWTARGRRVEVRFQPDQQDTVTALLGRHVEVWGRLSRNVDDQVLWVEARRFIPLKRPAEARSLTELHGIAPNLADGEDVPNYLGRLRGTS